MPASERPVVTLHFAQSIDARIARDGARTQLSSDDGVRRAHRARAEHDAVLVGAGTLLVDDPRLNVRAVSGTSPLRVILSSTLALPNTAALWSEKEGRVIVIGSRTRASQEAHAALESRGARAIVVDATPTGWVALEPALRALHGIGVRRVLVEGGSRVLTSFLSERLADRATIELSPRFIGTPAVPCVGDLGAASVRLARVHCETADDHVFVHGDVAYD